LENAYRSRFCELPRILGDASPEGDFQIERPAFVRASPPWASESGLIIGRFRARQGRLPYFAPEKAVGYARTQFLVQVSVEEVHLLAGRAIREEQSPNPGNAGEFSRTCVVPQFERGAARNSNSRGGQGTGTICGPCIVTGSAGSVLRCGRSPTVDTVWRR